MSSDAPKMDVKEQRQHIYLNTTARAHLDELFSVNREVLAQLSDFVDQFGISPHQSKVSQLADSISISTESIWKILAILEYLQDQFEENEIRDNQILKELEWSLTVGGKKLPPEFQNFKSHEKEFLGLIGAEGSVSSSKKLIWLKEGVIRTAYRFDTFLDLRPDFSEDRKSVKGFVPIAVFRARVRNDLEQERSLIFQINLESFDLLKKCVADLGAKIEGLQKLKKMPDIRWDA